MNIGLNRRKVLNHGAEGAVVQGAREEDHGVHNRRWRFALLQMLPRVSSGAGLLISCAPTIARLVDKLPLPYQCGYSPRGVMPQLLSLVFLLCASTRVRISIAARTGTRAS